MLGRSKSFEVERDTDAKSASVEIVRGALITTGEQRVSKGTTADRVEKALEARSLWADVA
jgi:hypothetical protein